MISKDPQKSADESVYVRDYCIVNPTTDIRVPTEDIFATISKFNQSIKARFKVLLLVYTSAKFFESSLMKPHSGRQALFLVFAMNRTNSRQSVISHLNASSL